MTYTIAQAAEQTGLSAHTLRYYERDGLLLRPVDRDAGGRRAYAEDDLRWITMVACLRATGMPIREVRHYAALVREGDVSQRERLDLLLEHRRSVLAQLEEVQRHLGAVDAKIDLYRTSLEAARVSA